MHAWRTVYGWQGLGRTHFPGLGARWIAPCTVPDLELFAQRYPGVRTVRFSAGLEVAPFHWSLWSLSWAVRIGVIKAPQRLADALMAMKRRLSFLGSDAGGMFMHLRGADISGRPLTIKAHLIARNNHGPYVPAIAAVILARKLARGDKIEPGARPCLGLVSLEEFEAEIADLAITISATDA